jgi:hypothetical protein
VVVPGSMPIARPLGLTCAADGLEEFHTTVSVRSCVLLSL